MRGPATNMSSYVTATFQHRANKHLSVSRLRVLQPRPQPWLQLPQQRIHGLRLPGLQPGGLRMSDALPRRGHGGGAHLLLQHGGQRLHAARPAVHGRLRDVESLQRHHHRQPRQLAQTRRGVGAEFYHKSSTVKNMLWDRCARIKV